MALSDTISQAEQRFTEQRDRLRSVVDDAVETADERVSSSATMVREQVAAWRSRSLEDLGRFGDWSVDVTRSMVERMPKLELPTVESMPPLDEVVNENFDYAQQLLEWNRSWTLAMIDAVRPLTAPAPATTKKAKKAKKAESAAEAA